MKRRKKINNNYLFSNTNNMDGMFVIISGKQYWAPEPL